MKKAAPSSLIDVVQTLIEERADPVLLVDGRGQILAVSPAAETYLASTPNLAGLIAVRVKGTPRRHTHHILPFVSLKLSISACGKSGAEGPYLVTLSQPTSVPVKILAPRQRQLLALVRTGLRNAEIATELGISKATVKTMLEKLYRQAGVHNRRALAHWSEGQSHVRSQKS